jgi:hypothetical protein
VNRFDPRNPKPGPARIEGIDGLSHTRAPRTVGLATALLALALAFAAGFTAAVYSVGFIVTATP